MAYRVKGLYTKKERTVLEAFVRSYHGLIRSLKGDAAAERVIKTTFEFPALLATFALYLDNNKILERVIAGR